MMMECSFEFGVAAVKIKQEAHEYSVVAFQHRLFQLWAVLVFMIFGPSAVNGIRTNRSWTPLVAPGLCYRDIAMATPTVGFAVAEGGFVVATKNGTSWTTVLAAGADHYWYGVHAFSAEHVIITGFIDGVNLSVGITRMTTDGGASWSADNLIDTSAWLTGSVQFKDSLHGFVLAAEAGRGHATSDGGKTWTSVPICDPWLAGWFQFDADGGIVVSGISYCSASGATWPPEFSCKPSVDVDADGPVAILGNHSAVVGGGDISPSVSGWTHTRRPDGTWNPRVPLPWPVRAFHFGSDGKSGLAAGGNFFSGVGGVHVTDDGGASWTLELNSGGEHHAVVAVGGAGTTAAAAAADGAVTLYTAACARDSGRIYRSSVEVGY